MLLSTLKLCRWSSLYASFADGDALTLLTVGETPPKHTCKAQTSSTAWYLMEDGMVMILDPVLDRRQH